MRKTTLILALSSFLLTAFEVNAQVQDVQQTEYNEGKKLRKGGFQKLDLTEEQKASIKKIDADYQKEVQKINNKKLTAEARTKKIAEARENKEKKINAVLTPEQLQKLENARNKKENNGQKRMAQKEFRDELNLTAQQKEQFKNIDNKYKDKMVAIRNNNNLSSEQKQEEIYKIRQAQKDEKMALLTLEQKKTMENRPEIPNRRFKATQK